MAAIVLFYTPSGKTRKVIFDDHAGELSPEEYKELMAELKTENFPIWSSPRATLLESKFYFELIYSQCLNRMLST